MNSFWNRRRDLTTWALPIAWILTLTLNTYAQAQQQPTTNPPYLGCPPDPDICGPKGVCMNTTAYRMSTKIVGWECKCDKDRRGDRCELKKFCVEPDPTNLNEEYRCKNSPILTECTDIGDKPGDEDYACAKCSKGHVGSKCQYPDICLITGGRIICNGCKPCCMQITTTTSECDCSFHSEQRHGDRCQYDNKCPLIPDPSACNGHGSCKEAMKDGPPTCECDPGFTGPECVDGTEDFCMTLYANQCDHGKCNSSLSTNQTVHCDCDPEWGPDSSCDKLQCGSLKACTDTGGEITTNGDICGCKCEKGVKKAGPTKPKECVKDNCFNYCQNGGVCTEAKGGKLSCDCSKTEYGGENCEILNRCLASPKNETCGDHGTCVFDPSTKGRPDFFRCDCEPGWYTQQGEECAYFDPCSPKLNTQPCRNGGECAHKMEDKDGFKCKCRTKEGWTGTTCERRDTCISDEYKKKPCTKNRGKCVHTGGATGLDHKCECSEPKFYGDRCEFTDACAANPGACKNGATCHREKNAFRCECASGFSGKNCEDKNLCVTQRLQPGAIKCRRPAIECRPVGNDNVRCECDLKTAPFQGTYCRVLNRCFTKPSAGNCYSDGEKEYCYPCKNGKCVTLDFEQVKDTEVGIIEADFRCDCAGTLFIGPLCDIRKTDVRLDFPKELTAGKAPETPFRIVLDSLGDEPFELDLDLGDGFKFELKTENFGPVDGGKRVYEFTQRYLKPGAVSVKASWKNSNLVAGSFSVAVNVLEQKPCLPFKVDIINCGRSPNQGDLPRYKRKSRFVIEASVDYLDSPCAKQILQATKGLNLNLEQNLVFEWQLNKLTTEFPVPRRENEWNLKQVAEHVDEHDHSLIFSPFKIVVGLFWIGVDVSVSIPASDLGLSSDAGKGETVTLSTFDRCFFLVEKEPPAVTLQGGADRTVQLGSAVKIVAIASDQTEPSNTKYLDYTWWLNLGSSSLRRGCKTFASGESCKSSTLEIDPNLLRLEVTKEDAPYVFSLQVSSDESKLTSPVVQQRIHVREKGLAIRAMCARNCGRWNLGDRILVRCLCDEDDTVCSNAEIGFSLFFRKDGADSPIRLPETAPGSGEFVVTLKEEGTHLVSCHGETTDSFKGESSLEIKVNSPPGAGGAGRCTASLGNGPPTGTPSPSGTFLLDKFSIQCTDFNTSPENEPLTYLVYAKVRGVDETSSTFLPNGVLLFHDVNPDAENVQIPSGRSSSDSEVEISVKVVDAVGGFTWAKPILVKITPPDPGKAVEIIQEYLGKDSDIESGKLWRRLEAGDQQGALQVILGILYTGVGVKSDGKSSTQSQLDFLLRIGRLLKKVPLNDNLAVQHVAQAHYLLCSQYVSENTTLEALEICRDLQKSLATVLQETVEAGIQILPTEDIGITARGLKETGAVILREVSKRGTKKLQEREANRTAEAAAAGTVHLNIPKLTHEEVLELDEADRDYFIDPYGDDDILKTNASTFLEVNDFDLAKNGEVERLAAIGQGVFDQLEKVLDAAAEREVDTFHFEDKDSGIRAAVHVVSAEGITGKGFSSTDKGKDSPIIFKVSGPELHSSLDDQKVTSVDVQIVETDSNPFFGDVDYPIDTTVTRVVLKDSETGNPITLPPGTMLDFFLPWQQTSRRRQTQQVTMPLVPGVEIDPAHNIRVYTLYLPAGSQLQVYIDPDPQFPDMLFTIVSSQDLQPRREDFCIDERTGEPPESSWVQDINPSGLFSGSNGRTFAHFYIEDVGEGADEIDQFNRHTYYIGIWPHDHVDTPFLGASLTPFGTNVTFNVSFTQTSCLLRDEDKNDWDDTKCIIGPNTTKEILHCRCPHLSVFAGSILIPPNSIDFTQDIEIILGIDRVPVVMATLGSILLFYICLLVYCYLLDRKDKTHHSGLVISTRIGEDFERPFYLITVITGSRLFAGTSANVSIQLYGSNGRSEAYVLKDPTLPVLNRGGNDSFLVSSAKELGTLEKIRVWHDNTGTSPGWFLRRVLVQNVKTNEEWLFFVETWLSLTYEDDPAIIREVPVAGPKDQRKWSRRFHERLVDELNNTHIWFSIFLRYPTSHFTRCQRLTCALAILASYMLINIMFFGIPTTDIQSQIEFGTFSIEFLSIWLSLQTTIFAMPFGLVLVRLFQRIRQRYIPTLIIWKNHTKSTLDYDEVRYFVPDDSGIVKEIVPTARLNSDDPVPDLQREDFSLPGTDIAKCEKWALEVMRGADFKNPTEMPAGSRFIRCVDEEGNTVAHCDKNETASSPRVNAFGRFAVMDYVRRKADAFSFFLSGDNDNQRVEQLLEEEIRKDAPEMARMKKADLDRVRDEERKRRAELPNIEPVHIIERPAPPEGATIAQEPPKYGIALELFEMAPVARRCCTAPWWFVYIAWTVCILVILACSLFTTVYGLRYGRLRSIQWVSGIGLALIQSSFVVQPFTILALALICTFFCEAPNAIEEERFQIVFKEAGENIVNLKPLRLRTFHAIQDYPPLSGAEIFRLRVRARRKNTLLRSAISIFFHILMIFFLCFIANSNHSFDDYYITNHLERMLEINDVQFCPDCINELDLVHDEETFYAYVTKVFLPAVFPIERYDGARLPPLGANDPTVMKDEITLLVGVPRIRQLRIRPHECNIPRKVKILIAGNSSVNASAPPDALETFDCITNYEAQFADDETYNEYWIPVNVNRTFRSSNDFWKYRPANETLSLGRRGLLGYYDGGGYVAELGKDFRRSHSVIAFLKDRNWIDHRTRGILIEFVVFNPNLNLFADVVLLFERSPSTAFRATPSITPLRLSNESIDEDYARWIFACYIAVAALILILSYLFINDVVYHWKHYGYHLFSDFWLWTDLIIIIVCSASLLVALYTTFLFEEVDKRLETSLINEYVSFQEVALWNFIHTTMFALSLCLCLMKFWKLLVLSFKRFYIMSLTLKLTSRFLLALVFLLAVLFTAFAMLGNVIFGTTLLQFHSFSHSFLELVNQLVGVTFYNELNQTHSILGPLYFFIFGFFVVCVGLNIFIALLNQGFTEAREVAAQKRNWLTYWSYLRSWYLRRGWFRFLKPKSGQQHLHLNPRQKMAIHPRRLIRMKRTTVEFIDACMRQQGVVRMNQMRAVVDQWLAETEYCIISKSEKWKRIRQQLNTARVSEARMDAMRAATAHYIKQMRKLYFTREDFRKYADFDMQILKLRYAKVERLMNEVMEAADQWQQVKRENRKVREAKRKFGGGVTASSSRKSSFVEEEFERRRRKSLMDAD